jgi:hypothetical protein
MDQHPCSIILNDLMKILQLKTSKQLFSRIIQFPWLLDMTISCDWFFNFESLREEYRTKRNEWIEKTTCTAEYEQFVDVAVYCELYRKHLIAVQLAQKRFKEVYSETSDETIRKQMQTLQLFENKA